MDGDAYERLTEKHPEFKSRFDSMIEEYIRFGGMAESVETVISFHDSQGEEAGDVVPEIVLRLRTITDEDE